MNDAIGHIWAFMAHNWEGVVAAFAMFAAVVSTYYAYRTFKVQREHNIKSVRPILHVAQWDYENSLRIELMNRGPGIAMVKSIEVFRDAGDIKTCIFDWLPMQLAEGMNYKEYLTAHKDFSMMPGDVDIMLELPVNHKIPGQRQVREQIRAVLRQLVVRVRYEDIYDNPMPLLEKRLHLYDRTNHENSSPITLGNS